ncbi:MerR family copper efflux transcriptional regulator [Paenibacillus sp. RC254]|uniref:MerR family transcriptional regulator n=1 Tax=unclassified Paenibacillus TaxID=185978 RepID=UPI0024B9FB58|nr:MerR family transcriptional regulator [Paenibacillus sp. RC334]
MEGMTRGELSQRTGLSMATIRYYENSGVLPAPKRAANGYRIYTDDYLVKIKFIKDAKSLGYSLREIQETLQLLSQEMDEDTLREIVQKKIVEIEAHIDTLHTLQSLLLGLLKAPQTDIQNYLKSFHIPE